MATIPEQSMFAHPYGAFDLDRGEFVITNMATPRPWCNVISNGRYGMVISHTGGGFSWIDNCQLQRITQWNQDLTLDCQGRFIYVQDMAEPASVWATTWQPCRVEADVERVRHGFGYTVYERLVRGIMTRHTVFVDIDSTREIWLVDVENQRDAAVSLRLTSAIDLFLGAQGDWHREFHKLFIETRHEGSRLLAWKHTGMREHSRELEELPFAAYHTASGAPIEAAIQDRQEFYGSPGRADLPAGLVNSTFRDGTGRWDDPMVGLAMRVALAPGESTSLVWSLGTEKTVAEVDLAASDLTVEQALAQLERVREHWSKALSQATVHTPEADFDELNNRWFRYQTLVGRMDARCAYYQQGGAYGFRDQLQDSLLCLQSDPGRTLQQLERHAEAMYEDGGVRHWWHPGFPISIASQHSDTCLWLAHGTLAYLDEANDLTALDRPCRYLDRDTQGFGSTGTLADHVHRGIERAMNRLSPRGLPLIGAGDWNDGLSHAGIDGKGESVWLAMFLYDILRRWTPILRDLGDATRTTQYSYAADGLQKAVENHAWDGEWYIAGTRDDGRPFGSKENKEGRIFLNTQTWAAITGIGSADRISQAMDSARRHLFQPYGALLLTPAFATVDPTIGYITRYAPGLRENGGVYSHASTWAAMALAVMGDVDGAYEMIRSMMPDKSRSIQDARCYSAEPYVMPGNVDGPDSPYEGRAGWTWYTGSSAWMARVAMDWILGVRATRDGLVVRGTGPSHWPQFDVRRPFRGDVFHVSVHGSHGTSQGPLVGPGTGETIRIHCGSATE